VAPKRSLLARSCGLSSTGADAALRTWGSTVRTHAHRHGFVIGSKVADLVAAGFHTIIYLADWHAYINDKLGGNLET